jgi:hypothetical protein
MVVSSVPANRSNSQRGMGIRQGGLPATSRQMARHASMDWTSLASMTSRPMERSGSPKAMATMMARSGEIEGPYVRCHLELCLPGPNAAALDAWASAAVDELRNAHSLGHLGDLLSLPHLPLEAADVVVLHAEDAMDAFEGTLQGRRIGHVGLDDLDAKLGDGAGLLSIRVPGQRPNRPMVLQQAAGHRPTLQAGRPHHRDDASVVLSHRCRLPHQDKLD